MRFREKYIPKLCVFQESSDLTFSPVASGNPSDGAKTLLDLVEDDSIWTQLGSKKNEANQEDCVLPPRDTKFVIEAMSAKHFVERDGAVLFGTEALPKVVN